MQYLQRISFTLPALLLFACVAPKGDLGEYSDTESPGGSSDGNGTGETGETGETGDTGDTSGSSGTGDGGDSDTDSATTGEALPACVEPGEAESFELVLDPPMFEGEFDGECVVSDGEAAHVLTCGEQKVELKFILGHQPTPLFQAGDTVQFSYRVRMPFYSVEWFSVRSADDDATLLLGGMAAETMTPAGEPDFFAPLTLAPVEGVCAATIDCDNHEEPHEVAATLGSDTAQLGVAQFDQVGDPAYDVSVITARRFYAETSDGKGGWCSVSDVPEYFYRVLVRRAP